MAVMSNSLPVSVSGSPWSMETETLSACKEALMFLCMLLPRLASIITAPHVAEVVIACVGSDGSPLTERYVLHQ